MNKLIEKYNIPCPRYTSYPTVPAWDNQITSEKWQELVKDTFSAYNSKEGISLYIHLPYCESLCTYCGCNTRITINHAVEEPYIDSVIKEWEMYLNLFDQKPLIKEIHLGGGTPTFFTPENLSRLISSILNSCEKTHDYEFSFEAHPANTTTEHLSTLYDLGFKRISLGIQDFNEKVQKAINRKQTVEDVRRVTEQARVLGYQSVSFDLVYGLPFQTIESVENTIDEIMRLKPDRISFYSYAHVPWKRPGQRGYNDADLPDNDYKRSLYDLGKNRLSGAGYRDVGMDHFALPEDNLFLAQESGKLHRNFMGYVPGQTHLLLALGVSSISDSWTGFAQNVKTVEQYHEKINNGEFPIFKGHVLTEKDLTIRKHILAIMCQSKTEWTKDEQQLLFNDFTQENLDELIADGLISVINNQLVVEEKGFPFLRNVCLAFDAHYWNSSRNQKQFSKSI